MIWYLGSPSDMSAGQVLARCRLCLTSRRGGHRQGKSTAIQSCQQCVAGRQTPAGRYMRFRKDLGLPARSVVRVATMHQRAQRNHQRRAPRVMPTALAASAIVTMDKPANTTATRNPSHARTAGAVAEAKAAVDMAGSA